MNPKKNDLVIISIAAKILNISKDTIKNMERRGILKSKRHPLNNYRLYSISELNDLSNFIEQGNCEEENKK